MAMTIKSFLSHLNKARMDIPYTVRESRILIVDHNQNIKEIIRVDFVPEKNAVIIEVDE
jgi:hypothetical protein